jgi:phosphatidylglycerophosphatase A
MLINNIVTVISSMFIGYYKLKEIIQIYKNKHKHININEADDTTIIIDEIK